MSYKKDLGKFPAIVCDFEGHANTPYEFAAIAVSPTEIMPLASGPIYVEPDLLPACARHNEEILKGAPPKETIIAMIKSFLEGRTLFHYGRWDRQFLQDVLDPEKGARDLMAMSAPFVNDFDRRRNNWPWPRLEHVAALADIKYPEPGPHSAYADAYVTARLAQILMNAPTNKIAILAQQSRHADGVINSAASKLIIEKFRSLR